MSRIRLLEDRLISQIAAGEVVERPASVVKELVENSLDAGATEVNVEIEAGGKRRIVIQDDGVGMDSDDALLAFDRHATSKIGTFEDLENVETLGFRGEALAAIASVARVELRTAVEPGDGQRVRIEGGRVKSVAPIAHPRGTQIEIASLFFNVPARRKFLKKPQTEMRRCVEVVQGYALAHPEVAFSIRHDGRVLLDAPAAGEGMEGLRERIAQIFGRALEQQLEPIPEEFTTETEAIRGFVGDKESSRGRRLFIYVNGRLVRDRAILARYYRSVRDEWKSENYPSLFLFLDIDPIEVDVNVHPQKAEVRFRSGGFVDRVEEALRQTLAALRGEEGAPLRTPVLLPSTPAVWEGLGGRAQRQAPPAWSGAGAQTPLPTADPAAAQAATAQTGAMSPEAAANELRERGPAYEAPQRIATPHFQQSSVGPPKMVPLSGRSGEARPFRILGQYKGSLIMLEGPDGLYLIDQHVAHERLLYERLRRSLEAEETTSQRMITPPILELSAAEALRLSELADPLQPCGFEIEPLSGNSVAVRSMPTMLSIDEAEGMLREIAVSAGEGDSDAVTLRRKILDAFAANLACKAAVKMHHVLKFAEMERLISELFECEQPYSCPHGRPVVLQMTDAELERKFWRR